MSAVTSAIRDLSRQLVALEADTERVSIAAGAGAEARVLEKLRLPLVRLAGMAGFRALLSRALFLSGLDEPDVDVIEILPDGALAGFDRLGRDEGARVGVVVVDYLLGLLMVFVGESLVMGIVNDAWPSALLIETDAGPGRQS